jgi:hypothetical protein
VASLVILDRAIRHADHMATVGTTRPVYVILLGRVLSATFPVARITVVERREARACHTATDCRTRALARTRSKVPTAFIVNVRRITRDTSAELEVSVRTVSACASQEGAGVSARSALVHQHRSTWWRTTWRESEWFVWFESDQ